MGEKNVQELIYLQKDFLLTPVKKYLSSLFWWLFPNPVLVLNFASFNIHKSNEDKSFLTYS